MNPQELKNIADNFAQELKEADSGKDTSLAFIIHQLPETSLVKEGEIFQVMVIGGTVCTKGLVKKQNNNLKILKKVLIDQNLFITNQDLFSFISKELEKDIKVLALNFAYPIKPVFEKGRLDGILLSGTKENDFGDLIGKKIGESLEKYILEKLSREIKVSVANDTICILLSGLTKFPWNKLVGGVVGTGTNFAFFLDEKRLVNLESGNFDKFPLSEEAKKIDKSSSSPGKYLFEKEIAGAYLYKHFNLLLEEKGLAHPKLTSTKQLDEVISGLNGKAADIAKNVLKRSADLVAAAVSGIAEFKKSDLDVCVEGSLFWKGLGYKEDIKEKVKSLTSNLKIEFIQIEDSNILGAAKLVA